MQWNVNEWTDNNKDTRIYVLNYVNADIVCLSETHRGGRDEINLPEYRWHGHNRHSIHRRAPKFQPVLAL